MPKESLWSKNYLRVFLSNLLLMGINFMIPSVFVLFLADRGGTDMEAGVAAYLYSFIGVIARPLAGRLLDTKERRVITLVCLAALAVSELSYIVIPVMAFLIFNRAVTGFFVGVASTALTTNAYDTLPPQHFNEGVGYCGFSNAIATAIGPGLGLFLYEQGGAVLLFSVMALMMVGALLLMRSLAFLPAPGKVTGRVQLRDLPGMFIEKRSVPAAVMECFCAVASGAMTTYMVPFLLERGIGTTGIYFACQASGTFCSRLFLGKISDRYGEGPLIYMSVGLFSCGLSLIVFGPALWCLCLGGLMMGFGYGFTVTGLQIMSVRIVPPERRGTAAATYACAWDIAAALGGLLGGVLVTYLSYTAAFACLLALYPAYFASYFFFFRHHSSAFHQANHVIL